MKSLRLLIPLFLVLQTELAMASENVLITRMQSPAKEVNWVIGNSIARKEFSFSAGTAWLDAEGNFQLKLSVRHQRIRCVQYKTGIQFGIGNPLCNAASWISSPQILSNKKHCNSAELLHTGGGYLSTDLPQQYQDISCARIEVFCNGENC